MDLVESYADELRFARKPIGRTLLVLLVVGLAVLPWWAPRAWLTRGAVVWLYAIGVLGQNLLIGYAGQLSFGQAGLLAIGALGFGTATYQIFANVEWLSGGRAGLGIPGLTPLFGLPRDVYTYLLYYGIFLVFIAVAYNLVSSYVGRAFVAIRDSDLAAEAMGVNLTRYKLLAFAISSFYTGVQGALFAQYLGHLEPQAFNIQETLNFFVAITVGGLASIEGSVFGAAFAILVPVLLGDFRWAVPVLFGVAILAVLIFEPLGLAGVWLKTRLYFRMWPFR